MNTLTPWRIGRLREHFEKVPDARIVFHRGRWLAEMKGNELIYAAAVATMYRAGEIAPAAMHADGIRPVVFVRHDNPARIGGWTPEDRDLCLPNFLKVFPPVKDS